jgi:alpha/beta superfamily hydrolase
MKVRSPALHFPNDNATIPAMPATFIGENPRLEAVYEDNGSVYSVIVTHPHSLMGGNMHNNVVMAAWDAALEKGFSTLRFNFRGVGRSGGSFDDGNGEVQDLVAALDYVKKPVIIIGYSFGAWIASKLMKKLDLPCIFVSPPTAMFDFPCRKNDKVWAITGEGDQFCNVPILEGLMDKSRITVMKHVDHFWFGFEPQLKSYLAEKLDLITSGSS